MALRRHLDRIAVTGWGAALVVVHLATFSARALPFTNRRRKH